MEFFSSHSVITGSADGSLKIINFLKLEETHNYKIHSDKIASIAVHPNQKHFISGSVDGTVSIVKTERKEIIEKIKEAHKRNSNLFMTNRANIFYSSHF